MKFYTHLLEINSLTVELNSLELKDDEKNHLANLIDSTFHNTILGCIFDKLEDKDKEIFLKMLSGSNHDKIWQFLNLKVKGIEGEIKKTGLQLKQKMHKDIKESKKLKIKKI